MSITQEQAIELLDSEGVEVSKYWTSSLKRRRYKNWYQLNLYGANIGILSQVSAHIHIKDIDLTNPVPQNTDIIIKFEDDDAALRIKRAIRSLKRTLADKEDKMRESRREQVKKYFDDRMTIKEAAEIIEGAGLLLERIKKYRTTAYERDFRDNRSAYDRDSIKHKMWDIIREEGIERYVDGIGFYGDEGSPKQTVWVEFRNIGEFGNMLVDRLSKAVGADDGKYRGQLYFNFDEIRKQSQMERRFFVILREILKDRFGVPSDAFSGQTYYATADEWLEHAKANYDRIEEYVEEKQYGGIHDLNYRKYRQAVKDAQAVANSPENKDKFVTNQYGFQKRIEVIYAKFRKFCRLFKREMERQRGNLTKPAEV